ncbi:VOC family protein [Asanoa iriomotensis]|uniref:Glyoxalase n=1 Tax=Asanoa iriomotensis TaxID=234613 RepID=A0ABQ4BYN8_9ACTN|nr:VOC family protein [Asanoa iriomotensis]GIF55634.1 glyoxalase [Asanoa iriomotensis]
MSATADMKLEVVVIPVSNPDRAKEFYTGLGWRLDADIAAGDVRTIQFTPPGSACSVQFGTNKTPATPGSAQNTYLAVTDIAAARADLVAHGVQVDEIWHLTTAGRAAGVDPDHRSYGSFCAFRDPDGNSWLLQEVTARLPGRVDPDTTTYASISDLAAAMRRASAAHGEHEKRIGAEDPNWPDWYAEYMVKEQSGQELPT